MPGWDDLSAAVSECQGLIAAAAPDPEVAREGEAYVTRVMASALAPAVLGHLLRQDGLSEPLPCQGGPNPDYLLRHAPVEYTGRYRLEGRLNGSERVGVGLYAFAEGGGLKEAGYAVFDDSNCGSDGTFSLEIAADPVAESALALQPGARVLLVRILHRDAQADPARLRLNGGGQSQGLTLTSGSNDGALAFVARSMLTNVRAYLKWTAAVQSHLNRFEPAPPELAETVQGDPDTKYYLGSFNLAEGEWLEMVMPAPLSGYWSIHCYNHWFEHLQTPGVDDRNARGDPDGKIRLAIGPDVPRHYLNRIDTLGRRRGSLICRIIGEGSCPATELRRSDIGAVPVRS